MCACERVNSKGFEESSGLEMRYMGASKFTIANSMFPVVLQVYRDVGVEV